MTVGLVLIWYPWRKQDLALKEHNLIEDLSYGLSLSQQDGIWIFFAGNSLRTDLGWCVEGSFAGYDEGCSEFRSQTDPPCLPTEH